MNYQLRVGDGEPIAFRSFDLTGWERGSRSNMSER
jgi:hypothetical protein